jgi:hypothetical protein
MFVFGIQDMHSLEPPNDVDRCTDKVLLHLMCNNYIEWEI